MFIFKEPNWVIRKIKLPEQARQVFLTFDDGPCPVTTPQVLDLFKRHNVQATFFVIGAQATKHPEIIQRMLNEGHSALSHSMDHDYSNYFKSDEKTLTWIKNSLSQLQTLTAIEQWAFRPPAGVLTPPVLRSALKLQAPLVLWNHRFHDSSTQLSNKKIQTHLSKVNAGDIVLLHDKQKEKNRAVFLSALEYYLTELKKLNFKPVALSNTDLRRASQFNNSN